MTTLFNLVPAGKSRRDNVISLGSNREIQAFIYDATTLEYAVGRDVGCKLKSVGKRYAETGYGVGFPQKSRWVKKFDEVLLRMQDDGETYTYSASFSCQTVGSFSNTSVPGLCVDSL